MSRLLLILAAFIVTGCVSVSENLDSAEQVGADSVILVGKVEIVPPIKPGEQSYKALDPFNARRHHVGRAILFMADQPQYQEYTNVALNPPLQETYFLKAPKEKPYIVKGAVTMSFAVRAVSRRQAVTDQAELLFPVPLKLDVRPGDAALYVGTLRLHRDEFHEVIKAEVRDDYAAAMADYRRKFPGGPVPRKSLLKLPN
jgi:hypothetical protein